MDNYSSKTPRQPTGEEVEEHIIPMLFMMHQALAYVKKRRGLIMIAAVLVIAISAVLGFFFAKGSLLFSFAATLPALALFYFPLTKMDKCIYEASYICTQIEAGKFYVTVDRENPLNALTVNLYIKEPSRDDLFLVCSKTVQPEHLGGA